MTFDSIYSLRARHAATRPTQRTTDDTSPAEVFARISKHFSPRASVSARRTGRSAVELSGTGCRVELSDGRTPLDFGAYAVGLFGHRPPEVVAAETQKVLETMRGRPGHIFNLGHGLTPGAKLENIAALVETVKTFK